MSNQRASSSTKVAALRGESEDNIRQYESRTEGTMSICNEVMNDEGGDKEQKLLRNKTVDELAKLGNGCVRTIDQISCQGESSATKLAVLTGEDNTKPIHEYDGDDQETTGPRRFMSKTGHSYIKRVRFCRGLILYINKICNLLAVWGWDKRTSIEADACVFLR